MKLAAMFIMSATIQAEKSKHLLVEVEDKPPSPHRHSIRGQNKAGGGGGSGRTYECDHECNGWPYQNCKVLTLLQSRIHSVSTDNLKHAIILQTLDLSEQVDMEGRLERWKRKYIVLPSVFQRCSRIP